MDSNFPILGQELFTRFNPPTPRPVVEPGIAIVLFRDNGELTTLMPGQRLTAGDVAWKNYKGFYKVDIGIHSLDFQTRVPCNKDAFNFEVKLQVTYQVEDPTVIVKNKIRDVLSILKPAIENRMRTISRRYNAEQSEDAEQEINQIFGEGLRVSGFFASHIVSNLELEPAAREHLRTIQNTRNEIARQEAVHELEITRSKHDFEIKKLKMDFYAPLIKKGQWNLLALQLAEHPEDIATIVSFINQQQQADRDNQLKLLKIMLENGIVDGFQIEDAKKKVLQKLLDSLTPVDAQALTDGTSDNVNRVQTPSKKRTILIPYFFFVTFPKAIGRFILDMFGRDKATDASAIILGYIAILIVVLIAQGFINPDDVVNMFKDIWRFFFPIK